MLPDIKAVDHTIGEKRIDLDRAQTLAPFREAGLQSVIELDSDGIGQVTEITALGLSLVQTSPSGHVHIDCRRPGEGNAKLRREGPMAVGAWNEFAEPACQSQGWLVPVQPHHPRARERYRAGDRI